MEQATFPSILPPVTLRDGNPARIIQACRVAAKAVVPPMSLLAWDEFAASFYDCARGSREEQAKMMDVVRSYFDVTTTDSFSDDPTKWDFREQLESL